MELTRIQQFKISVKQKQTLSVLHTKYKINTSQFIRDAINEKLERDKKTIFRNYKEIQDYLKTDCPF